MSKIPSTVARDDIAQVIAAIKDLHVTGGTAEAPKTPEADMQAYDDFLVLMATAINGKKVPDKQGVVYEELDSQYYLVLPEGLFLEPDGSTYPDDATALETARKLKLNMDPRDRGFLLSRKNRIGPKSKFYPERRLHAMTETSIAALNLGTVGDYQMGALIRAMAVSMGALEVDTKHRRREYVTTGERASKTAYAAVLKMMDSDGKDLLTKTVSLVTLFGLLHLQNDHTHQRENEILRRRQRAYALACVGVWDAAEIESILSVDSKCASFFRHTVHPIGILSPYLVALNCCQKQVIPPALDLRQDVSPTSLQGAEATRAACMAIRSLPVRDLFDRVFGREFKILDDFISEVHEEKSMYLYSALVRLYVHADIPPRAIPSRVEQAVEALNGIAAGFAAVYFTRQTAEGGVHKVGLGQAKTFESYAKKMKPMVDLWTLNWANYRQESAKGGVAKALSAISVHLSKTKVTERKLLEGPAAEVGEQDEGEGESTGEEEQGESEDASPSKPTAAEKEKSEDEGTLTQV